MIGSACIVSKHVGGLSYYPNFISVEQKARINSIISSRQWCTRLRRHQQYYGIKYFQTKLLDSVLQNKQSVVEQHHEDLSHFDWLIRRMIKQVPVFQQSYPPNQCLVNKYLKHDRLGLHVEDKLCYGPVIAAISLGCRQYLRLNHQSIQQKQFYMQLQDCSLYVLKDEARQQYRHGIARAIDGKKYKNQSFQRVSLTFRHVIDTRRKL